MPDPITLATTQVALRTASAGASLARAVGVVPPGRQRHHRHREERSQAYARFQQATFEFTSWIQTIPVVIGPVPAFTVLFRTPMVVRAVTDARASLAEFLGALAQVRLVGNPEPRAAAEEIAVLVSELAERLPTPTRSQRERARQEERLAEVQRALAEAHKRFILTARRDLGYARPLRTRWWQWRRPRSEEEWPGGWPGPAVRDLLEGEQQPQQPRRGRRWFRRRS